jgi:threonine dehydrogenase-like Zn-dependent dehydrogenase
MKAQAIHFLEKHNAEIREIDVPDPGMDDIQIRCVANGICMGEVSLFNDIETDRWPLPRIVGHEGVGVVEKVGKDVENYKEGDWAVCREWSTIYNIPAARSARFSAPPKDPATVITEPVDCIAGALYSYDIMPGDRVLLIGAGYMGLLNVQGLASCPLGELVVCDIKQHNLDLAKKFGANKVINAGTPEGKAELDSYRKRPFDLVVESSGAEGPLQQAGFLTRDGGRLAVFGWHHGMRSVDFGEWHLRGLKVLNSSPVISTDRSISNTERAVRLMENGVIDQTDLITHRYKFEDIQHAMEESTERAGNYIKGVLLFE